MLWAIRNGKEQSTSEISPLVGFKPGKEDWSQLLGPLIYRIFTILKSIWIWNDCTNVSYLILCIFEGLNHQKNSGKYRHSPHTFYHNILANQINVALFFNLRPPPTQTIFKKDSGANEYPVSTLDTARTMGPQRRSTYNRGYPFIACVYESKVHLHVRYSFTYLC